MLADGRPSLQEHMAKQHFRTVSLSKQLNQINQLRTYATLKKAPTLQHMASLTRSLSLADPRRDGRRIKRSSTTLSSELSPRTARRRSHDVARS